MPDTNALTRLDFMSHTEIRAMLRGATQAKVLFGWCLYDWGDETFWIVSPPEAQSSTYTTSEVVDYCRTLAACGVQPRFRSV
jgi:hypothetical protein